MDNAATAVMAIAFFGVIAVTVRSVATVWGKRIDARRGEISHDAEQRLARIENAVDAIAIEVERISEGQRFSARLDAERDARRIPAPGATTPH